MKVDWVTPPTDAQLLDIYTKMLRIRLFEEEILRRERQGEGLAIHSCAGHEGSALGVISQLTTRDLVVSNHRPWGHFLAKGGNLRESFAELLGKETGVCGGIGGEMHLSKMEVGFVQSSMIVGACLTIACGVALTLSRRHATIYDPPGPAPIAVVFFGEGASTNGAFNEALTLAKVFKLPLLFVCENNGLSGNVPAEEFMSTPLVTHRAAGYGFPTMVCDGSDVIAVWEAAQRAIDYVRTNRAPYLLECLLSRVHRHKVPRMPDVRPDGVKRLARMRDPLPKLHNAILAEGVAPPSRLEEIREQVLLEVADGLGFAEVSKPWKQNRF